MAPLIAEKTYPVQVGNKAGRKALITTSFHLKLGNRTIKEVDHLKVLALKVHRTITGTNSTSFNDYSLHDTKNILLVGYVGRVGPLYVFTYVCLRSFICVWAIQGNATNRQFVSGINSYRTTF